MDLLKDINELLKINFPGRKIVVDLDTKFSDISALDSLGLAIIAVALEEKYHFHFRDEYFEEIKTKTIAEVITEIKFILVNQKR